MAGSSQTSFNHWQGPSEASGGATQNQFGPAPIFRNNKDYQLAGYRTIADTTYPDGYLGTMSSNRRQDKILGSLSRMNARQYSRGVHKGERINAGDYIWPDEFNLWTGIAHESRGQKFAPPGAVPVVLTNDGKVGPKGIPRVIDQPNQNYIDAERRAKLQSLRPSWR
jgi:hypothetical protein